jgi:MerR family transcriptional regulator, light-induced transcriptional regulator
MRADTQAPARGGSPEQVRDGYLAAPLTSDLAGARAVVDEAIAAGVPVRASYLEVLQPTLYEVGRRWSHAEVSIAQEHLATAEVCAALRGLDPAPYVLVGGQAFGGSAERFSASS